LTLTARAASLSRGLFVAAIPAAAALRGLESGASGWSRIGGEKSRLQAAAAGSEVKPAE